MRWDTNFPEAWTAKLQFLAIRSNNATSNPEAASSQDINCRSNSDAYVSTSSTLIKFYWKAISRT